MNRFFIRPMLALIGAACLCASAAFATPEASLPTKGLKSSLDAAKTASGDIYNSYLERVHPSAYYHLYAFTDTGHEIQLHDDSRWAVRPSHQNIVLRWVQNDALVLKPSAACFPWSKFVLFNCTTQETIDVELLYPVSMSNYTVYIVDIDPYNRLVRLNDNTIWSVDSQDKYFGYWQIGHRLLIGVNNGYRSAPLPHILINIDLANQPYSKADFYTSSVYY